MADTPARIKTKHRAGRERRHDDAWVVISTNTVLVTSDSTMVVFTGFHLARNFALPKISRHVVDATDT